MIDPKEVTAECEAMHQTFDLRQKADMRAIKRWQAAHPGNDLTWPDHADMVVWLLERLDLVTTRLRAHALSRCPDRVTGATKYTHCDECDARWNGDQPERHKPECVLFQPST